MKPITSDQYPLPAKRPRNPVPDKDKLKRVCGIEMPHWEDPLRSCMAEFVPSNKHGLRAKTI